MDISETWKKLEKDKLSLPIEGDFKKGSHHLVSKLKKNYFIKSILMIFFVVMFLVSTLYFDEMPVKILCGFLTVAYLAFLAFSFLTFKEINLDGSVIDVLTRTKEQITRALRFEWLTSLMIYPIAGAAGYLAGFSITGRSVDKVFSTTSGIATFVAAVVIMTIVGCFLGRKLTKEGYGNSLAEISKMIEQLKS